MAVRGLVLAAAGHAQASISSPGVISTQKCSSSFCLEYVDGPNG